MMETAAYAAILADARLPTPGPVAIELLALARQPEVAIAQIASVIAMDPALSSRVLRAVNAPTIRTRRYVTSIDQAVTVLGLRAVSGIATAVSVLDRHRGGTLEFDYGAFWSGSLARAVAAQALAAQTRKVPPDEAFTCGLLSQIGRLALVTVHAPMYRHMLLTLGNCGPAELAEAERSVFKVDTETLSACMMREWGMPAYHNGLSGEASVDAAGRKRDRSLVHLCQVGSRVADLLLSFSIGRGQLAAAMQAMANLGLDAEVVAYLFPDILTMYRESGAQLQIAAPCVHSLADLYVHAIDAP